MAKSESSHWYYPDGKSCHSMPYSDKKRAGESRPTTLKDARALKLLPSVTGILGVLDKPMLTDWKLEQLSREWRHRLSLLDKKENTYPDDVVFALRDMLGRDFDELHEEIVDHSMRQVEEAADAGELIHKGAELALQGLEYDHDLPVFLPELKTTFPLSCFIKPVEAFVKENGIKPLGHEVKTVCLRHGYAGTGDLPMTCNRGRGFGDFKSRKTKPGKPVKAYDTQVMQIAAYHGAHFGPEELLADGLTGAPVAGFNLYISTTEPGRIDPVWYGHDEVAAAYPAFTNLCAVWRFLKGYDPRA